MEKIADMPILPILYRHVFSQGQRSRSGILHYAHAAEWSIYGIGLPSAKENRHDTWNTVQDLCVFVNWWSWNIRDQELRAVVGGF